MLSPRSFFLLLAASVLLAASSALAAAPTITSFTPGSGRLGGIVTLTGTNFASPATVNFNGVASPSVTVVSATSLKATVPNTAATGKLTVTTSGGTATSASTYTVLPGILASVTVGPPTAARTVYFSGFSAYEAVDLYFDTNSFALGSAQTSGAGNNPFTLPASATPGTHWLTAIGRKSGYSAQTGFTVRTDSNQYGFRPSHRGNNSFENVLNTGNVSGLEEAWRAKGTTPMIGVPAVVGGYVYAGFGDGTVRSLSEATGAQRWSFQGGNSIEASPCVVGNAVYVASTNGDVYALDSVTGQQKWIRQNNGPIHSSPVVDGGLVYVASQDGTYYKFNATDGAPRGSLTAAEDTFYSSPAVANGSVYIGGTGGSMYAFPTGSSLPRWRVLLGGSLYASPAVVNGIVYIGCDDKKMYALDADTGKTRWAYPTDGPIRGAPAVAGGIVYFSSTDGKVYALYANSGKLRWSTDVGGSPASAVVVANGVVYVGGGGNGTSALVADYGAPLTDLPASGQYGGPVVVNGALTVGDDSSGTLVHYTLDAVHTNAAVPRPAPSSLRPSAGR